MLARQGTQFNTVNIWAGWYIFRDVRNSAMDGARKNNRMS